MNAFFLDYFFNLPIEKQKMLFSYFMSEFEAIQELEYKIDYLSEQVSMLEHSGLDWVSKKITFNKLMQKIKPARKQIKGRVNSLVQFWMDPKKYKKRMAKLEHK